MRMRFMGHRIFDSLQYMLLPATEANAMSKVAYHCFTRMYKGKYSGKDISFSSVLFVAILSQNFGAA